MAGARGGAGCNKLTDAEPCRFSERIQLFLRAALLCSSRSIPGPRAAAITSVRLRSFGGMRRAPRAHHLALDGFRRHVAFRVARYRLQPLRECFFEFNGLLKDNESF